MPLSWISVNERLQVGVKLINQLSIEEFRLFLLNFRTENTQFSEILKYLQLTEEQSELLVQSFMYIYKQARRIVVKPKELQEQLVNCVQLDLQKAEELTRFWFEESRCTLEEKQVLHDISWEIDAGKGVFNKEIFARARLQLNGQLVECNDKDMVMLYNVLEQIQTKLDLIK